MTRDNIILPDDQPRGLITHWLPGARISIAYKHMEDTINIEGLDKAEVLAALYNASKQQGMGFTHKRGALPMTKEEAAQELAAAQQPNGAAYFDYLHGRVMKVRLVGDQLDPWLYDRDNGQGAAERAINTLRA